MGQCSVQMLDQYLMQVNSDLQISPLNGRFRVAFQTFNGKFLSSLLDSLVRNFHHISEIQPKALMTVSTEE